MRSSGKDIPPEACFILPYTSSALVHVRKVVGGFGKKSCVSTGEKARKHVCVTDRHDMTLVVKVALNPNTTNQPSSALVHLVNFQLSYHKF